MAGKERGGRGRGRGRDAERKRDAESGKAHTKVVKHCHRHRRCVWARTGTGTGTSTDTKKETQRHAHRFFGGKVLSLFALLCCFGLSLRQHVVRVVFVHAEEEEGRGRSDEQTREHGGGWGGLRVEG
jgi:hypothetical protein